MISLHKLIRGPRATALLRYASTTSVQVEPLDTSFTPNPTFYAKDMEIILATPAEQHVKPLNVDGIKFGHVFSDHMAEIDWSADEGWTRPLLSPIHNLQLHPGSKCLHYAIQLFEGMKAYRGVDNRIRLFKPYANMERMRRSAARCALPDFDGEELLKIIANLVQVDKEWTPYSTTSSLYIRPTFIGVDPTLGVAHSQAAKLFVLTGPVGAFYPTGMRPISLFADSSCIRAFPGGIGEFKMGANYAPTILVGKRATELGCQQVLWLYGEDEKLTEVGTMNIFVYWINENGEEELVTPPLTDGIILPGVTRDALLTLCRHWGEFKVTERYPTMEEIRRAIYEKRMKQVFGAGTACVVSPVSSILYRNPHTEQYEDIQIPTMTNGTLMQRLNDTIVDIQYGRQQFADWTEIVA